MSITDAAVDKGPSIGCDGAFGEVASADGASGCCTFGDGVPGSLGDGVVAGFVDDVGPVCEFASSD